MLHNALSRARRLRRDESGFTLIELLIVIIILGVLAAIVVFSVRGISDNGEEAACRTEIRTVETAVEAYYAENDAYPATVGGLTTGGFLREDPDGPSTITAASTIDGTTGAIAPAPACD
ncbi:prepilin-type N-terminal cleavage/methylation domain-containing protein [Nocardioides sp. SYSU DS0651]|uniref:prepilin-type N-terminal cleavage/methylation domain-containing protein n=1 Tax=Nocardioides sp. SYSU DS0651 TaxID=3415955 RepID=UPI003F4C60E4